MSMDRSSKRKRWLLLILVIVSSIGLCATTLAQELAVEPTDDQREYSPFLARGYPQLVFWSDTHLHTTYSTDAGMIGNRLGPDEAYQFARGEQVVSSIAPMLDYSGS